MRRAALKRAAVAFSDAFRGFGWFSLFGALFIAWLFVWGLWLMFMVPVAIVSLVVKGDWRWASESTDHFFDRYMTLMETAARRAT